MLLALIARAPAATADQCTIARSPDVPVTMTRTGPMVHAQLNGKDALLLADSGAFFSLIVPRAVQEYQLHPDHHIENLFIQGVGGRERAQVVQARTFELLGKSWENVDFVVGGERLGDLGAVGVLGQNVFRIADVEYDLANGVIRLVWPKGDCKDRPLAYWAAAAQKPYSVLGIEAATVIEPHTKAVAYLNGKKIRVLFDTGAGSSMLTIDAAKRTGITPNSPGVASAGASWGIGRRDTQTWIARFASFRIGDEEIQNAQLRFGDIELHDADMLIGADFFLSHRIYVASGQKRLYFTYNGGPVFDLAAKRPAAESAGTGAAPQASPEASAAADESTRLDLPTDAAGFARRAAASDARHDFDAAIVDLTHACQLAPTEAAYFYQRGVVYLENQQPDPALADFDQAIRLKPDDGEALIARARLRHGRHEPAAAVTADLDAADRALPGEAETRLVLGNVYQEVGQPGAAVTQYSKWIDSHPHDQRSMAMALNSRCWVRALAGQELGQALLDCNAALKLKPNTASFLDSRGLVHLRQGNYDKAIADYDAALHLEPKTALSLYGRGLAKSHKGLSLEGQADITAATALEPAIAERARKFGIAE
jgi:tetratricopeptide (TPR) repeat protein